MQGNDQRIVDASDYLHAATAHIAEFDVDIEHMLQALRPYPAL
jgi:hypothetical protein